MTAAAATRWEIVSTVPLSGAENMAVDLRTVASIKNGTAPPTLRFFRWREPTLSFGRLQKLESIAAFVPNGWPTVKRPTGGGLVHHDKDLCISLAWPHKEGWLPSNPRDQYQWIHSIVLEGLRPLAPLKMAACCDVPSAKEAFATRACFSNPVGFDLLLGSEKIVGGALYRQENVTLYQGSIHLPVNQTAEKHLRTVFEMRLESYRP